MNCVWKQRIDSVMHNAGGEITVKKNMAHKKYYYP